MLKLPIIKQIYDSLKLMTLNRDRVVGIMTGLRVICPLNRRSIPNRSRDVSLLKTVKTCSGVRETFHLMDTVAVMWRQNGRIVKAITQAYPILR